MLSGNNKKLLLSLLYGEETETWRDDIIGLQVIKHLIRSRTRIQTLCLTELKVHDTIIVFTTSVAVTRIVPRWSGVSSLGARDKIMVFFPYFKLA